MTVRALHFSTHDVSGGAAIAAYRLHQGLQRAGVESRMVVRQRRSSDPTVSAVDPSLSRAVRLWSRAVGEFRRHQFVRRYGATRSPTLELFSDDRVPGRDLLAGALPPADVLNAHWVAGLLDYRRFFRLLPAGTPFVWTLHDMNPFTGGCHYDLGCGRWRQHCHACPQLGAKADDDLSAKVFARKASVLARLRPETTRIVAPSAWLRGEAAASALLGRFRIDQIPNSVDTEVFRPRDRRTAREVFDLPQDAKVVLFAADRVTNHRKGLDLLVQAVEGLEPEIPLALAAIGHGSGSLPGGTRALGRIDQPRLLSFALSAADLFVLPTRADNLPNVILEAMACGVPVVSFDVGGVPDMVRPGVTGLLAPPEDVGALRRAIATLLEDDALRHRLGTECRRVAVEEYALEIQARRYMALYEELLDESRRLGVHKTGN